METQVLEMYKSVGLIIVLFALLLFNTAFIAVGLSTGWMYKHNPVQMATVVFLFGAVIVFLQWATVGVFSVFPNSTILFGRVADHYLLVGTSLLGMLLGWVLICKPNLIRAIVEEENMDSPPRAKANKTDYPEGMPYVPSNELPRSFNTEN